MRLDDEVHSAETARFEGYVYEGDWSLICFWQEEATSHSPDVDLMHKSESQKMKQRHNASLKRVQN
jgi:hypothetical protein